MKRYVSLICCLVFVVSLLAFPISADDTSIPWYNVLDYSSANNTGGNYFSFTGSTTVSYELPAAQFITYVDIVFMSLRPIASVTLDMPADTTYEPQNLLLTQLSYDGKYYFYNLQGPVYSGRFYEILLNFEAGTSYETYVEIYSFRTSSSYIALQASWDKMGMEFLADGENIVPVQDGLSRYLTGITADLCEVNFNFEANGARKVELCFMGSGFSELFVYACSVDNYPVALSSTVEYLFKMYELDAYCVSIDLSQLDISGGYLSIGIQFSSNDGTFIFEPPYLFYPHDDYDSLYPYYYGIVEELKSIDADLAELLTAILESNQLPDNFNFIMSDISQTLSDIRNGFGSSLLEYEKDFDNIQEQLEDIVNYSPTPELPDNSGVVGDLGSVEDGLLSDAQNNFGAVDGIFVDTNNIFINHAASFLAVAYIVDLFTDIPAFSDLLKLSVAIGIFATLLSVGASFVRSRSEAGKSSGKKEGK